MIMASSLRQRGRFGVIARLIARSPILTGCLLRRADRREVRDLPSGYEAVDLFILQWIAAEALRSRRKYLPL
jgi:predicted kinase